METIQILQGSLLNWLEVLVLSGIKFVFAPVLSMGLGFSYIQTIIITSLGGLAGVYFFYYLSETMVKFYNKSIYPYFSLKKKHKPIDFGIPVKSYPQKSKRSFTFKNKTIVRTRTTFGIRGIAMLTPILLSIPLGAFLVNRYYGHDKKKFVYMGVSVVLWSFLVTSVLFFLRNTTASQAL